MAGDSSPNRICSLPSEDEPGDTVRGLSSSAAPGALVAIGHPVMLMLPRVWFSQALMGSVLGGGSQCWWPGLHRAGGVGEAPSPTPQFAPRAPRLSAETQH